MYTYTHVATNIHLYRYTYALVTSSVEIERDFTFLSCI